VCPDSNAATRSGNGGVQSCATAAHWSAKPRQERGFRIVSVLEETSPQLSVPAPVPEEGLGGFGVLSQSMCLELCTQNRDQAKPEQKWSDVVAVLGLAQGWGGWMHMPLQQGSAG